MTRTVDQTWDDVANAPVPALELANSFSKMLLIVEAEARGGCAGARTDNAGSTATSFFYDPAEADGVERAAWAAAAARARKLLIDDDDTQ